MSLEEDNKNNNEEPSRIGEMEKKLYSRKEGAIKSPKRTELHSKKFYVPEDWVGSEEGEEFLKMERKAPREKMTLYTKVFIVSLIFFFGAVGVGGYFFFSQRNFISPENVELIVFGPVSIKGGDQLDLQVVIENNNTAPLTFANLVLEFPQDSRAANDSSREFLRYSKPLGKIAPGEIRTETIKVVLLGDERTRKEIKAELTYGIDESNATYTKNQDYSVSLTAPPLSVVVDLLDEVNAGQEITLTANISSNASAPLKDPIIRIDYPAGFVFQSASPEPLSGASSGRNIWRLGNMEFGEKREIVVKGVLQGENDQEKAFWVYTGLPKSGAATSISTLFSSILKTVELKKPFLGVDIFVNGDKSLEYNLVERDKGADISIQWENNLPDKIINGEIQVGLKGDIIDRRTVTAGAGGFYRSSDDTTIWERRTTPSLVAIGRGEKSVVGFSFKLLPSETQGFVRKEPVIEIEVSVKGQRVSETNVPEEVRSFVKRTIKVGTQAQFAAKALHSSGPIENTGPMSPKVGEETTYTVVWNIKNLSSTLSNARMVSTLPPYVRWTGKVFPNTAGLIHNDVSNDIVWEAGTIPAGTGIETPMKEVAFQVVLTPSLSHEGKVPEILLETKYSGKDTFTGYTIEGTLPPLTTRLEEPGFSTNQGTVVP